MLRQDRKDSLCNELGGDINLYRSGLKNSKKKGIKSIYNKISPFNFVNLTKKK